MAHYPIERREAVVRRMLNEGISIPALAKETGIAQWTLYRWREAANTNADAVSKAKKHDKRSAAQKLAIVAETGSLNEAELAQYCRQNGLYPDEVKTWRTQAEQAIAGSLVSAKQMREALGAAQRRNKELERELRRKEKAFAETAALLTLRKKAAAIWGDKDE